MVHVLFQIPWIPEILFRLMGRAGFQYTFRGMAKRKEMFPREVVERLAAPMLSLGALRAGINYYRGAFRSLETLRMVRTLPDITVPTLVIWGRKTARWARSFASGSTRTSRRRLNWSILRTVRIGCSRSNRSA
ncbi:MAG: hypothetical protein M5R36_27555 [Deltaproteobacteria bacterium]|nr:hypothetical protein [Deltaproteobacteria bacterium]